MQLEFSPEDPLFCVAFHPAEPQFVVGFATGRVECHTYDRKSPEKTTVLWQTKRHKESCRCVAYTQDGSTVITAGSDLVVKRCDSQTGKVNGKAKVAAPPTAMALNEEYVTIGDEAGNLVAFKLDLSVHRKYRVEPSECVSAVCCLPVNKHSFAVSGDMHVFRIDVRKDEIVSVSEDQEDDIVCGCVASESKSAWGMSEGVVTVWNNRGLSDQQHRIRLTKEGSVDALLAAEIDDRVIAGTSDGWVGECDLASGQCLYKAKHNVDDEEEDVMCLDYDCEYRLVSASMTLLRMWSENELQQVYKEKEKEKASKKRKKTKGEKSKKPKMFEDL